MRWGSSRRRRGTPRSNPGAIWPIETMRVLELEARAYEFDTPVESIDGVEELVEEDEEEVEEVAGGLVGVGGMIW